jgi:hypothetical protein
MLRHEEDFPAQSLDSAGIGMAERAGQGFVAEDFSKAK